MDSLSSRRRCSSLMRPGRIWGRVVLVLGAALGTAVTSAPAQDPVQEMRQEAGRIQKLLSNKEFPKAARRAETLVKKFPDEFAVWMVLANVHLQEGWSSRKDARALEAARRARELGGDRPDVLFALATAHYRQREENTTSLLDELLAKQPTPFDRHQRCELLFMRAALVIRGENQDEATRQKAFEDLNGILQLNPKHGKTRQLRADALRDDGQYEKALEDLRVVYEISPGNKQLHYGLYSCYRGLRDMEKAQHHLRIWKLVHQLTDSIARTSAPEPEERLALLRELRELNPDDVRRRLELVQLELMLGELDNAEREWKALKERYPEWQPLEPLKAEIDRRRVGDGSGEESR